MPSKRSMTVAELAAMGGRARAKKLTEKERKESARQAAMARWSKAPKKKADR